METSEAPTGAWSQLSDAAGSGNLLLEPNVAARCAQRCGDLVDELKRLQVRAIRLHKVEGLGHLPSGIALASKFGRKASGGEYSLDQALIDHIAEVEQMRDVFLAIENRYAAAEEVNTAATAAVESQIN
ncbi:hypothetical protein GS894_07045 [Rhodococcus hoagii]|uniref:hypothetical protein n=1 Tax=Rhodococcus hoagii TaxID=43767 RepID=UPI0005A26523|nr:hypothetical protein [Prescottella equi]NKR85940.1 hypothetical protein [Prescottella equi]NKS05914.1 hypothetical protein [Prescottella equi]NKS87393.1 hypothetical protein [Prescottella equi]NKS94753.1 hypothetical protein [Prescottella equi]NKT08176.1 hypothetical protein [Prescottella equi]